MKNTQQIISTPPPGPDGELVEETGAEAEIRALSFSSVHHGMRLDLALTDLVPEFSRSYLQQLIDLGSVLVNGKEVTMAELPALLGTFAKDTEVHLRADKTTPYEALAQVLSASADAGLAKVGFVTELPN